jgi:hypothetical protein
MLRPMRWSGRAEHAYFRFYGLNDQKHWRPVIIPLAARFSASATIRAKNCPPGFPLNWGQFIDPVAPMAHSLPSARVN